MKRSEKQQDAGETPATRADGTSATRGMGETPMRLTGKMPVLPAGCHDGRFSAAMSLIVAAAIILLAVVAPAVAQSAPATADVSTRPLQSIEDRPIGNSAAPATEWDLLRTAGALAVVIALILIIRSVMKRMGGPRVGGRGGAVIEIVGRRGVTYRHQVILVRMGRRLVLVGIGPEQMTTLSEVTDPDEVAALLGTATTQTVAEKPAESK
ncbi:MAG: flagellar biosynthetic protein FliO [Planctomycetaceae bacterium]|nr:flagellar biosynthetic protein FliO [Planctomycetaceae bacterium]